MVDQRNGDGKNSQYHHGYPDEGESKRRDHSDNRKQYARRMENTVYRYLCLGRKIGIIIGKGGDAVRQLREETKSRIKIGDSVLGCDERVVTICSSSLETNVFEITGDNICPAQDALLRVHDSVAYDEGRNGEDGEEAWQVTARLLVPSDQVGCIIGKGGKVIHNIRTETGTEIRIIKNDLLPPFAMGSDAILQIIGDESVVKKALYQMSFLLHDNPSKSQHLLTSGIPHQYDGPYTRGDRFLKSYCPGPRDEGCSQEFSLILVCPIGNVGGVIGKGGSFIKKIKQDTEAYIEIDTSDAEADDCTIFISSEQFFEDPISPTIDAALRLQPRCSERTKKESGESYTTRLLVPSSSIGCLLGKGGAVITEMRRLTRASIFILSKEDNPKVACENEQIVQIGGQIEVARNALVQVATRLKNNHFGRRGGLSAYPPDAPYRRLPMSADYPDLPRYDSKESKDSKSHRLGYSSYSSIRDRSSDLSAPPYHHPPISADYPDVPRYGCKDSKSHRLGDSSYWSRRDRSSDWSAALYHQPPMPADYPDVPRYGSKDSKSHRLGDSSYSSRHDRSSDLPASDSYGRFDGSQVDPGRKTFILSSPDEVFGF
ncbi:hypothetical protein GIB67_007355 [Kingdonia uniflora]|uniref:K Homology domain-containing protein n=1 Tax=Kingdonia uniflora TaxID=39325 RepID=A0A7J7NY22_9MAGN|nr:hypothetical protein GIB67_007355 [Kingdonia uniflora]